MSPMTTKLAIMIDFHADIAAFYASFPLMRGGRPEIKKALSPSVANPWIRLATFRENVKGGSEDRNVANIWAFLSI